MNHDGIEIYYEFLNNKHKKNLVLVNGVGSPIGYWLDLPKKLSRHFNVLVYDNRGVGKSSKPWFGYSVNKMESDLFALLNYLHIEHYSLLGVSLGGLIAQHHLAIRDQKRIERVVLASTHSGILNAKMPSFKNPVMLMLVTNKILGDMRIKEVLDFLSAGELERKNPTLFQQLLESRQNEKDHNYLAFQGHVKAGSFYLGENLTEIKIPILIVHGKEDKLVPYENASILKRKLKKALVKVKIYENAGHLLLWENEEVYDDILDFLSCTEGIKDFIKVN